MAVTVADVERVAELARLSFTEEEKQRLVRELNKILNYMEQLNRLDTRQIEPLSHGIELANAFREDTLRPCLNQEEVLRNAPARTEQMFKVPKAISDR